MPALHAAPAGSPDLIALAADAAQSVGALIQEARRRVRSAVLVDGRISSERLEAEQHAAHGLAWLATYAEAIRELGAYSGRMRDEGRFGELEELLVRIGLGEYLEQLFSGVPMSQGEVVRLHSLGMSAGEAARFRTEAVDELIASGNNPENRARLVAMMRDARGAATFGDAGLDSTLEAIRTEMRRFGEAEVAPHAQGWHLANAYIPLEVVVKMAEMGVFGLTIPEEYGGMGLSKVSMCVVSEELSRAYIGVGSLGTRSAQTS